MEKMQKIPFGNYLHEYKFTSPLPRNLSRLILIFPQAEYFFLFSERNFTKEGKKIYYRIIFP